MVFPNIQAPQDRSCYFGFTVEIKDHHHQAKGTGLGHYLSRQIFTAHGGKHWADPLPTEAKFNFTLPAYLDKFPTATLEQPLMKPYD